MSQDNIDLSRILICIDGQEKFEKLSNEVQA